MVGCSFVRFGVFIPYASFMLLFRVGGRGGSSEGFRALDGSARRSVGKIVE